MNIYKKIALVRYCSFIHLNEEIILIFSGKINLSIFLKKIRNTQILLGKGRIKRDMGIYFNIHTEIVKLRLIAGFILSGSGNTDRL